MVNCLRLRSTPGRNLKRNKREKMSFSYRKIDYLFIYFIFQVQLSPFSLIPSPSPTKPHLPSSILPHFGFVHGFIQFLDNFSPSFSCYPPPPSLLVTISLFFILLSLFIFCLLVCFVDQVLLIGEITWYLSFTPWLISLSIMLSRSIHGVAKGRSSFCLSAA